METKKVVKVSWFPKNTPKEEVIKNTGLVLDNICLSCIVDEDDITGNYILDGIFLIDDDDMWENLQEESIIKVKVDYGEEIFVIASKNKNKRDITILARQITIYQSLGLWLNDVRPTNQGGQGAVSHMINGADGKKKEIIIQSDITETGTAYYQDMSLYKGLHDCENSFTTVWGGETTRRSYTVTINKSKGMDRGVTLRRGKNILGFEGKTNIDELCTRIKAKGFNGITPDVYIDSPIIDTYDQIYTRVYKYEDVKVKDENNPDEGYDTLAEAQEELIRRAKLEFSTNRIDELRGDYRISFLQLEQTEECKQFTAAERVYPGDYITVIEDKLGVNIKVRAIRRKYDVMRQITKETELSNTPIAEKKAANINSILKDLKKEVNNSNNSVQEYIQAMINAGCKDSYILYRQNEILAMDTKDINTATTVSRFNKNGLAFSKTGYYGQYIYGYTIDGVFNASLITTGILSAILIRNLDGSFEIDLSGSGGALFRNNNKDAIKIINNQIKFYNWAINGDYIGSIGSLYASQSKIPYISMWNDIDSVLSISYEEIGVTSKGPYIEFDKYNLLGFNVPIVFREDATLRNKVLYFGYNKEHSMYSTNTSGLAIRYSNSLQIFDKNKSDVSIIIDENNVNPIWFRRNVEINGDLIVNGKIYENNANPLSLSDNVSREEYNLLKKEVEALKKVINNG